MSRFTKVSMIAVLAIFVALAFATGNNASNARAQTPSVTAPATLTATATNTPENRVTMTAAATTTLTGTTAVTQPAPTNPPATNPPPTAAVPAQNTVVGTSSVDCPVSGVTSIVTGGMSATAAVTMNGTMAATMQMGASHDMAKMNIQATAAPAATLTPDAQANAIFSGILQANKCAYSTTLSGDQEVPGPGDNDAIGTALVSVDPATNQICYALAADKITYPAAAAHIHKGAAGVSGPVVVPFPNPPQAQGSIQVGCVTADSAIVKNIADDPAGYYVNVHTSDFPNGAVRGQLFGSVRMSGDQEVPGPGAQGGIGLAGVSVDTETNTVCYSIYVRSITLPATAAHIHKGAVGVSGPVVVGFKTAPDGSGRATGCVENVDAALVKDIAENPEEYYVNIHNADFANGAVRGQLNGIAVKTP